MIDRVIGTQQEIFYGYILPLVKQEETFSRVEESTTFLPSAVERQYAILRLLEGFEANDSILDLGCGGGVFPTMFKLMWNKFDYIGVDHEKKNVNHLVKKGFKAIKADLLNGIPKIPGHKKFDYIICSSVMSIGDIWTKETSYKLIHEMWKIARKAVIFTLLRNDKDELYGDCVFNPVQVYSDMLKLTKRVTIYQTNVPHFITVGMYKYDSLWFKEWRKLHK